MSSDIHTTTTTTTTGAHDMTATTDNAGIIALTGLDYLTCQLDDFCDKHGLEKACAMELLMGAELTGDQRLWLTAFCKRWDHLQGAGDAGAAWANEQPYYTANPFPSIPATFRDESWHNDEAAKLYSEARGLFIWCDEREPVRRWRFGPRFIVADAVEGDEYSELIAFESWSALTAWLADAAKVDTLRMEAKRAREAGEAWKRQTGGEAMADVIADQFSRRLSDALTEGEMAMVRAEALAYSPFCASADYLDANMPMADAFEAVMGFATNADSEDDARLWNEAWEIARDRLFDLAHTGHKGPKPTGAPVTVEDEDEDEDEDEEVCALNRQPVSRCPAGCDHGAEPVGSVTLSGPEFDTVRAAIGEGVRNTYGEDSIWTEPARILDEAKGRTMRDVFAYLVFAFPMVDMSDYRDLAACPMDSAVGDDCKPVIDAARRLIDGVTMAHGDGHAGAKRSIAFTAADTCRTFYFG